MASFLKWFKERTRKSSKSTPKASIQRLGKLPPLPRDEYGFNVKHTETHIYEEIDEVKGDEGEVPQTKLEETPDEISQTLQKLDFAHAKEVGPYLVVPIVNDGRDGNDSCDSGTGDLADLILSGTVRDSKEQLNVPDAVYDQSKSLYSSLPPWARAKLKDTHCKRHGLALKQKEKGLDETFNEYNLHDISSISSCSDQVFNSGNGFSGCYGSDSSDSAKTFNEYDIDDYVDDKSYEYFLVKAEKNFLLEKELKQYIEETSDSIFSSSSNSDESLTTVTDMSDVSTVLGHGYCRNDCNIRVSAESLDHSGVSDSSCYCCRGQNNSLFCAKASNNVNSVLLVHRTPSRKGREKPRRDTSSKPRDSVQTKSTPHRKTVKFDTNCASSSTTTARRHSVGDITRHSPSEFKFTRSNTMPERDLERPKPKDTRRKSQKDIREKSNERQRKPKEYKLPEVRKDYVFSTDSEYKFCTNPSLNRNTDRYSCRATNFVPKKSVKTTSGSVIALDETYGSIYGTIRGRTSQNRLLGDMMRMNHDRQVFFPR